MLDFLKPYGLFPVAPGIPVPEGTKDLPPGFPRPLSLGCEPVLGCGKALVVLIGGGGDVDWYSYVMYRLFYNYCNEYHPHQSKAYFSQDSRAEIVDYVLAWKKRFPGHQIALIGHSWGGHTAWHVADFLALKKVTVDLLATLDPVGTKNFYWPPGENNPGVPQRPQTRPSTTTLWLNIIVQDPPNLPARAERFPSPNEIAKIGQPWRSLIATGLPDAEWSIASATGPEGAIEPEYHLDNGHARTFEMFDIIRQYVEVIQ